MNKPLGYTFFHTTMMLAHGKTFQAYKAIEEMKELTEAINSGNREHIVEELADVELTLPYINKFFGNRDLIITTSSMFVDFNKVSVVLEIIIELRLLHGNSAFLNRLFNDCMSLVIMSIPYIYEKYSIKIEEVEEVKKEKIRRTLKRLAKKIIGGNE